MDTKIPHVNGRIFRALVVDHALPQVEGPWTFVAFGAIGAYPGFHNEAGDWIPLHAAKRAIA